MLTVCFRVLLVLPVLRKAVVEVVTRVPTVTTPHHYTQVMPGHGNEDKTSSMETMERFHHSSNALGDF